MYDQKANRWLDDAGVKPQVETLRMEIPIVRAFTYKEHFCKE
jgi:hypothetical protein